MHAMGSRTGVNRTRRRPVHTSRLSSSPLALRRSGQLLASGDGRILTRWRARLLQSVDVALRGLVGFALALLSLAFFRLRRSLDVGREFAGLFDVLR
jgi:hypothetical protein